MRLEIDGVVLVIEVVDKGVSFDVEGVDEESKSYMLLDFGVIFSNAGEDEKRVFVEAVRESDPDKLEKTSIFREIRRLIEYHNWLRTL